jgi:farnesyl-diphosphate farnesyltransferase
MGQACDAILGHAHRTVVGMRRFVEATNETGYLRLHSLDDLRRYCYVVVGIVGGLLTELFVIHSPQLRPIRGYLHAQAPLFGEALQLVNVLKDAAADSARGRVYLPPGAGLAPVFSLARQDLFEADQYINALCRADAPASVVRFTRLPVALARGTLDAIERFGPGAKLSRADVAQALRTVNTAPV